MCTCTPTSVYHVLLLSVYLYSIFRVLCNLPYVYFYSVFYILCTPSFMYLYCLFCILYTLFSLYFILCFLCILYFILYVYLYPILCVSCTPYSVCNCTMFLFSTLLFVLLRETGNREINPAREKCVLGLSLPRPEIASASFNSLARLWAGDLSPLF